MIHRHQPGAGTRFNRHVADRHAAFHTERANGSACKFNGVAGAARRADFADDGQHDVFASAAHWQRALDLDQQVFGFFSQQCVGGQHVFNLTRANAVRQRPKRAVGGCVRVTANNRHAGQRRAIFGPHHMHDALAF